MLSFFTNQRRAFYLSIGDDGAVLVYMVGGQMEGRFFFAEAESLELERVLATDPSAPIHIFADISDQSYNQASLPPVSALNIQKLVQRRLVKDFDKTDIKGALLIERSKTGRRDWNYLFVSIRTIPPFSLWLETLSRQQNRIAGIYLLPVEAEAFIRDVKKAVVAENVMKPSIWQMLITHNKVGGLRQVILKNGRVAFTRMAQPVGGTSPGVVAGNIEQEALSTIEFMRRLGYEAESGLDILIVTAAEVKRQLEPSRFHATNVFVLTPHEIAGQLGLERATEPKDKFADVVMLTYFGQHPRRILKLTTPTLKKVEQFFFARLALKYLPYAAVPVAVVLSVMSLYGGYSIQDDITRAKDELARASANLKNVQSRSDGLAARKKQVSELLSLSDLLAAEAVAPFTFLSRLAIAKENAMYATEIQYAVLQAVDKTAKKTNRALAFKTTLEFPNTAPSSEAYLKQALRFKERTGEAFKGLTLSYGGLPGEKDFQMDLGANPESAGLPSTRTAQTDRVPQISLTISGPLTADIQARLFTLPEKKGPILPQGFVPVQERTVQQGGPAFTPPQPQAQPPARPVAPRLPVTAPAAPPKPAGAP